MSTAKQNVKRDRFALPGELTIDDTVEGIVAITLADTSYALAIPTKTLVATAKNLTAAWKVTRAATSGAADTNFAAGNYEDIDAGATWSATSNGFPLDPKVAHSYFVQSAAAGSTLRFNLQQANIAV